MKTVIQKINPCFLFPCQEQIPKTGKTNPVTEIETPPYKAILQ